jgi:hypothetical protein
MYHDDPVDHGDPVDPAAELREWHATTTTA